MDDGTPPNAPIVQLLLTASFTPTLSDLTMVQLVEVSQLFRNKFPVFRQISPAGPMLAEPPSGPIVPAILPNLPRIALYTESGSEQIFFQADRLSFGWNRSTPLSQDPNYPGFAEIFREFLEHLQTLKSWAATRGSVINPLVGEIVYTDAFVLEGVSERGEVPVDRYFQVMNPSLDYPIMTLSHAWFERLGPDLPGFVRGAIEIPTAAPDGSPIAQFETTSAFEIGLQWDRLETTYGIAHGRIHEVYARTVTAELIGRS